MNKKLAICVPYRDRKSHLQRFIPCISDFLKKREIEHKIFISHQLGNKSFNRGKMKNIAYDFAQKEGYDYFAFHDIDLLPEDNSCDYSIPYDKPIHLSAFLSYNNYRLLFPENFGGVVLFTKDQFRHINGYYNDYWGWGAEDDDLFLRCKRLKLINQSEESLKLNNKCVASFNGKNSSIEIDLNNDSIEKAFNGNFTFSMLLKKHKREDVPNYAAPLDNLVNIPILTNGQEMLLNYTNDGAYEATYFNENNEYFDVWVKRETEEWTEVTYVVDRDSNTISLYINGEDVNHENKKVITGNAKFRKNEKIIIGKCKNSHDCQKNNFLFKGEIGNIRMWNVALKKTDIKRNCTNSKIDENVVLAFDFEECVKGKIKDYSKFGNHGKLVNVDLLRVDINKIKGIAIPERRFGRYKCLPHENEGFKNGVLQCSDSKINEIIYSKVKGGEIDTWENGLSNLKYKIQNVNKICENHVMINSHV